MTLTARYIRDTETQTRPCAGIERSTSPPPRVDAEVQTDSNESSPPVRVVPDDSVALLRFMEKTYPLITQQLIDNTHSHAFDGYSANWADDESDDVSCLLELSQSESTVKEFQVTCISWNAPGNSIVIGLGRLDHQQLCTDQSQLCLWNIDRHQKKSEQADKTIDVFGCLTAIEFHPKLPSIITGANFNGDVCVWDFSREDDNLLCSTVSLDDGHQDPVAKVQWMRNTGRSRKHEKIISCGSDGKILIWQFNGLNNKIKLINGFVLMTENIPRTLRVGKGRNDAELGVTCLCFSPANADVFIAGTENGTLFKFSSNRQSIVSKDYQMSVPIRSPVVFAFQSPHVGPVSGLCFSPFHRNVFLSCGTDGAVKIYSILQVQPLLSIDLGHQQGALTSQWSYSRPLVFYVSTVSGHLMIFDLKVSRISAVQSVMVDPSNSAIYAMMANPSRTNLVATGTSQAAVKIWSLPSLLTEQLGGPDEAMILDSLASKALSE